MKTKLILTTIIAGCVCASTIAEEHNMSESRKSKFRYVFNLHPVLFALFLAVQAVAQVSVGGLQEFWTGEYERLTDRIQRAGKDSVPVLKNGKPTLEGRPSLPYHDVQCLIWDTDRDPADIVLRRTRALLIDVSALRRRADLPVLDDFEQRLGGLEARGKGAVVDESARRELFVEVCELRRRISHANPLLDFREVIFVACGAGLGTPERPSRPGYWQYMGFNSLEVTGEGPTILADWKSDAPQVRNVVPLPQREGFRFHSAFDLSFDGREILFGAQTLSASPDKNGVPWKKGDWKLYDRGEGPIHIFRLGLEGGTPTQLTRKGYNNGFPAWLPDGRVAYISDYVQYPAGTSFNGGDWGRGADRCGGWTTRLWSMKSDGTDAFPISWHETPEYHPVVDWNGKLVYSRWDYLDRGLNVAHNLWTCFSDGRDPRAPHGNYPYPHHILKDGPPSPVGRDGRGLRPLSEINIRPIPGSPGKYTASAGAHHHVVPGVPIMIDTNMEDDNLMSQVKMLAGTDLPNEANRPYSKLPDAYYTPWPLSEDYYLVSKKCSVLLMDKFGNEILICAWPQSRERGCPLSARPLRARTRPPVLPTLTWQGERRGAADHQRATIFLANVYDSADQWPEGMQVKRLRILQYILRPFMPDVPGAYHVIKRVVLGSVPVEKDGSAYFEAPVQKLIYFQALDKDGLAVQSMRSGTYVHPGEQMTCLGCHERRMKAVPSTSSAATALALRRAPSKIEPALPGSNPLSYKKLVYDDIFQKKCLACHKKKGKGLQDFTFEGLDEWTWGSRDTGKLMKYLWRSRSRGGEFDPVHGGHRNIPGRFGARESGLGKLMLTSHRERITDVEFKRVMLWLDANSVYSSEHLPGRTCPLLEYDPANPTGVEIDRPSP